jgi:hypothetical protein
MVHSGCVSKAAQLEDTTPAAREGETNAIGDAALGIRFTTGGEPDGSLQRKGNAARQRPRRLEMMKENIP